MCDAVYLALTNPPLVYPVAHVFRVRFISRPPLSLTEMKPAARNLNLDSKRVLCIVIVLQPPIKVPQ